MLRGSQPLAISSSTLDSAAVQTMRSIVAYSNCAPMPRRSKAIDLVSKAALSTDETISRSWSAFSPQTDRTDEAMSGNRSNSPRARNRLCLSHQTYTASASLSWGTPMWRREGRTGRFAASGAGHQVSDSQRSARRATGDVEPGRDRVKTRGSRDEVWDIERDETPRDPLTNARHGSWFL